MSKRRAKVVDCDTFKREFLSADRTKLPRPTKKTLSFSWAADESPESLHARAVAREALRRLDAAPRGLSVDKKHQIVRLGGRAVRITGDARWTLLLALIDAGGDAIDVGAVTARSDHPRQAIRALRDALRGGLPNLAAAIRPHRTGAGAYLLDFERLNTSET